MPSSSLLMPLPLTDFFIDKPKAAKARLLLAHGAGAGADSDFMQQLSALLVSHNIEVWRFNFAYMQRFITTGKRSLPDKMPALQQQFVHAINTCPDDLPLFIAGKSMGGRVASMLSQHNRVKAVFAFGYPFHAPKKLSWRTEHFSDLACPLFIAQGERDNRPSECTQLQATEYGRGALQHRRRNRQGRIRRCNRPDAPRGRRHSLRRRGHRR